MSKQYRLELQRNTGEIIKHDIYRAEAAMWHFYKCCEDVDACAYNYVKLYSFEHEPHAFSYVSNNRIAVLRNSYTRETGFVAHGSLRSLVSNAKKET